MCHLVVLSPYLLNWQKCSATNVTWGGVAWTKVWHVLLLFCLHFTEEILYHMKRNCVSYDHSVRLQQVSLWHRRWVDQKLTTALYQQSSAAVALWQTWNTHDMKPIKKYTTQKKTHQPSVKIIIAKGIASSDSCWLCNPLTLVEPWIAMHFLKVKPYLSKWKTGVLLVFQLLFAGYLPF